MDDEREWIAYCIDCQEQLHEKSHSSDMLELAASFHTIETDHTVIIGFKNK